MNFKKIDDSPNTFIIVRRSPAKCAVKTSMILEAVELFWQITLQLSSSPFMWKTRLWAAILPGEKTK
ncbi:MAG: hypothetical protein P4L55_15155 [Syntrophobacteraceae bacterium]|nr:hypothetical protein [Syntrophobacteraceae bacterium]